MSLYSALYAGVSGLSAQASAMAGVADNITNINTVGYKTVDTQFRTLVADGAGGGAKYSAAGVAAVARSLVSKEGVLGASSSSTDIGIEGQGFFVTRDGAGPGDSIAYTRAGSFTADKIGYLKNSAGYYLQGWPLSTPTSSRDLTSLVPIRVDQLSGTAAATTKLAMRANLDQSATAVTGYTPGKIAAGSTPPQFKKAFDITDAQGRTHSVTLAFVKTGTNTWAGEIYANASEVPAPPAANATATPLPISGVAGLLASSTITFNANGSLNLAASVNNDGGVPGIFGSITPAWTNGAGSGPIKLGLGTEGGLDGLTQFASTSAMQSYNVDGGLLGKVASTNIAEDGVVSAVFDDGTSLAVFQLPIASFQNADGLTRLPGNAYVASAESGGAAINAPGALGGGTIASKVLEASTVDLAQEFTNMIRFQRAYSASSKIITTVDEMLQEVSNLKR